MGRFSFRTKYKDPTKPVWPDPGAPRLIDDNGYVRVWTDGGYEYEHRLVAAIALGRPLSTDEHAHHEDEVRTNNDPGNLKVITALAHRRMHSGYSESGLHKLCSGCGDLLPADFDHFRKAWRASGEPGLSGLCIPCDRIRLREKAARYRRRMKGGQDATLRP